MANQQAIGRKQFTKYLIRIDHDLNAYFRSTEKTSHACLVLHQHLGLVQNLVQTVQSLIGKKVSIFIPDLFSSITQKSLLNNEFDPIQKIKYSRVHSVVIRSLKYLKQSHSEVFLLGFSIGAAFGFKLVQQIHEFSFAFLFYGFPDVQSSEPEKIKTKTYIFCGSKDRIKYLSDEETFEKMVEKNKKNPSLKFEKINGLGHGFLNPDSQNYSKTGLAYCQKIIFKEIPKALIDHQEQIQIEDKKEQKKKDEGCNVF